MFSATENFAPTRRRRMPCCVARRARLWVGWLKSCPSPSSSQRLRKTPSTASSRPPTSSRELGTRSPSDASTGEFHLLFEFPFPFSQSMFLHSGTLAAWAPRSTCTRRSRSCWRSPRTPPRRRCRCGPCTRSLSSPIPEGQCSGRDHDPRFDPSMVGLALVSKFGYVRGSPYLRIIYPGSLKTYLLELDEDEH